MAYFLALIVDYIYSVYFVLIYWNRLELWYCIICGGVELEVTTTLAIISCSKFHQ